jgi:hypothetical protein
MKIRPVKTVVPWEQTADRKMWSEYSLLAILRARPKSFSFPHCSLPIPYGLLGYLIRASVIARPFQVLHFMFLLTILRNLLKKNRLDAFISDIWKVCFFTCISIQAHNETNLLHYLSSVYSVTIPLHISDLLFAHHQEVTMYICNNWYMLYVLVGCQLAWLELNSTPNRAADSQLKRTTCTYRWWRW